MKKVKFGGKQGRDFSNTLRARVNEYFQSKGLSQKGNWKMMLKVPLILSLYIVPFIVMLTVGMPWWFIFWLSAIMGFGLAATGMSVMHDATHGSLSEKNWLNRMMSYTMYILGGSTFTWKVQHNYLHHNFTNIDGHDEDLVSPFFLRFSPHTKLRWIHRFQHLYAFFFYCFLTFFKMVTDFTALANYTKEGLVQREGAKPWIEFLRLSIVKLAYLFVFLVLPMLVTDFTWWQVLLGFTVSHMVAGLIMSTIFQLAHVVDGVKMPVVDAEGKVEDDWAVHQMETTVNFSKTNPILTFFVGGLNYQVEHHLFPNISHIHYPEISQIVEKTAKEFGVPYHQKGGFWAALASHIRMLRTLGRKPAMA